MEPLPAAALLLLLGRHDGETALLLVIRLLAGRLLFTHYAYFHRPGGFSGILFSIVFTMLILWAEHQIQKHKPCACCHSCSPCAQSVHCTFVCGLSSAYAVCTVCTQFHNAHPWWMDCCIFLLNPIVQLQFVVFKYNLMLLLFLCAKLMRWRIAVWNCLGLPPYARFTIIHQNSTTTKYFDAYKGKKVVKESEKL